MTTESMKPYPAYKDSGIEWIGEIPEGWEVSKIKYIATNTVDYGLNISGENYVEDGIRFLRTTDIDDFGNLKKNGVYLSQDDVDNNFLLHDGDLLISRSGTIGRAYVHKGTNEIFSFAGYLVRFSFSDIDISKFIYYLTKSSTFGKWLKSISVESTIGNVNGQKYANYQFALPLTEEIQTIIKYLNLQIIKIDTLIENKQTQIELLKEERTAIINQAVTKGLNPDVPMRDSGIEWLGEIPEHWEILSLKRIASLKSGESITAGSIDKNGDFPVFGGNGLRGYTTTFTHDGHYILIGRQGALCGNINYAQGQFWASEHAVVVSPTRPVETKWLGELLNAMNLNQYSVSAAQPGLSVEMVSNLRMPQPPLQEQSNIATFLDKKDAKITTDIEIIQQQITLLQEYRTALISDAVTGKIDLRNEHELSTSK